MSRHSKLINQTLNNLLYINNDNIVDINPISIYNDTYICPKLPKECKIKYILSFMF